MGKHDPTLALSRRSFIVASVAVGSGFVISCATKTADSYTMGPFLKISSDNTVTLIAKHIEFGQGSHTGLAAIAAEELDADWAQMRTESAPADINVYYNLAFGPGMMGTGGSSSIANSWPQLRQAGAAARAMLVKAAAQRWNAPEAEISVAKGVVSHVNRRARFGELAEAAAKLPAPQDVQLKDPAQFTLIGSEELRRLDSGPKTRGAQAYTIDTKPEGTRVALIARPPKFGATVKRFDVSAAGQVPGVVRVVEVPSGVAVVAQDFWSAKKGRDALDIEWDFENAETRSSSDLFEAYRRLAAQRGEFSVTNRGNASTALRGAAHVVEQSFEFPYLAHASMEPLNAVAQIADGKVTVWTGCQFPTMDKPAAAAIAGVDVANVTINTLQAGGSFGRRANYKADFVSDAVNVAKAMGDGQPVNVQWTREDDMTGGLYRPMAVHKVSAGLNAAGDIVAWRHVLVIQNLAAAAGFGPKTQADAQAIEGLADSPYLKDVAHVDLSTHHPETGVSILWWRSVGNTHTAFVMEHMIDLCARAAGQDPVDYRRRLLTNDPRRLAALNLAVEKSGYPAALPAGRAYGVAVHECFGSVVADVAEVSIVDGMPKTHKVTVAFDCGIAVTPDQVRAQSEGALGYGLGAALYDQITLKDGEVEQKNFDTYAALRMPDMPHVETHIAPSSNPPSGVGEPGTPVIAPAVANAVLALTGAPTGKLPFKQV